MYPGQKSIGHRCIVYLYSLSSIPLVCMFTLMPVPHLDYDSIAFSFDTGKHEPSKTSFFFKIVVALWVPLQFYMNLKIKFSISAENVVGILVKISLYL